MSLKIFIQAIFELVLTKVAQFCFHAQCQFDSNMIRSWCELMGEGEEK